MPWHTTRPSLLVALRDPADHAAWREFDAQYGDLISRFARSAGLQHADAEEVRQNVLTGLASALPQLEYDPTRGRFRSYLGRSVRHAIIATRRRAWSRREVSHPPIALESTRRCVGAALDNANWDARWDEAWRHHHLRRALDQLQGDCAPEMYDAFHLMLSGQSLHSVAEASGRSYEWAKKTRQRIGARLREIVSENVAREETQWAHGWRTMERQNERRA